MISRKSRPALAVMMISGLMLAGCGKGDGRVAVVPVKGKVVMNGEAVADATVGFHLEGAPVAQGKTNAQGEFTLTTYESGDGAVPGMHTVTVVATTGEGADTSTAADDVLSGSAPAGFGDGGGSAGSEKSIMPEGYNSPRSSPLKIEVKADGKNDLTVEITS